MFHVVWVVVLCTIFLAEGALAAENGLSSKPIPNYPQWAVNHEHTFHEFKTLGVDEVEYSGEEVLNPSFHYRLFLAVLQNLAALLSHKCSVTYDQYYYVAVKKGIEEGWTNNLEVAKNFGKFLAHVRNQTGVVIDAITTKCQYYSNGCENKVQDWITQNPNYKIPVDYLRDFNAFSEEYLKNTYEVEAKNRAMVQHLLEGKEKMRKLSELMAAVMSKYGYNRGNFECPTVKPRA